MNNKTGYILDAARLGSGQYMAVAVDSRDSVIMTAGSGHTADRALGVALTDALFDYGVPDYVLTDNGPACSSAKVKDICRLYGIQLRRAPAYNPTAKPVIERAFRDLTLPEIPA